MTKLKKAGIIPAFLIGARDTAYTSNLSPQQKLVSPSHAHPLVMGIINVTPDSFSDGGLFDSFEQALRHATQLIEQGADWLDVGGESTRPGSMPVDVQEELRRVIPVVEALVEMKQPVSVDTSKPEVMRAAIKAGATMINDVNALRAPGALEAVAAGGVAACLMHMQGEPRSMQLNPEYHDVVSQVREFLSQRVHAALESGISHEQLIIDPGFGFGKTQTQNIQMLRQLGRFCDLGVPVMVGMSRKSMLGKITGGEVSDRLHASVAAALVAVAKGARIVRVHDVKATKEALAVYNAVNG